MPVRPSETFLREAWSTSFSVGPLLFTLRFEAGSIRANGWNTFFDEIQAPVPGHDTGHLVKFDNSVNELQPGREFLRLPEDHRLAIGEVECLERHLVGAVGSFCADHAPEIVVGLPNDPVLARWYRRLIARNSDIRYQVAMRKTRFHPHRVLILQRS